MRSDVVQIAELAASRQNIHRQALSAKAKSATGSSGCGSFASGSTVIIFLSLSRDGLFMAFLAVLTWYRVFPGAGEVTGVEVVEQQGNKL